MKQEDIDLLDRHGWDVICESPFEIEHRETGTFADGIVANMTLQMLRDNVISFTNEIADAQAEMKTWTEERRKNVQLEGTSHEDHSS